MPFCPTLYTKKEFLFGFSLCGICLSVFIVLSVFFVLNVFIRQCCLFRLFVYLSTHRASKHKRQKIWLEILLFLSFPVVDFISSVDFLLIFLCIQAPQNSIKHRKSPQNQGFTKITVYFFKKFFINSLSSIFLLRTSLSEIPYLCIKYDVHSRP